MANPGAARHGEGGQDGRRYRQLTAVAVWPDLHQAVVAGPPVAYEGVDVDRAMGGRGYAVGLETPARPGRVTLQFRFDQVDEIVLDKSTRDPAHGGAMFGQQDRPAWGRGSPAM